MASPRSEPPTLHLWRRSVKLTTLWALLLIFLMFAFVLTARAERLEPALLAPRWFGFSLAQVLTVLNLLLGIYLLWDLGRAWRVRGPLRRGHVAGVVLAILLVAALHLGIEVVSLVVKRLARA